MKKLTKSLLVAGAMVAASSASAFVDNICPVVGIDYQQVWMGEKSNQAITTNAGKLLPKSYPGASVYIGSRLCEYLGLELGYDWAAKKTKNSTATFALGGANVNASLKSSVRRQGGHLDIITYLPVADCFELMFSAGVGYVSAKMQNTSPNAVINTRLSQLGISNTKPKGAVGRIRLGGNYMFDECMGARALLGWESTESLHAKISTGNSYRPFKDSMTASVGLFYKF